MTPSSENLRDWRVSSERMELSVKVGAAAVSAAATRRDKSAVVEPMVDI